MFDSLSDRLDAVFSQLKSRGRLNEKNIEETLREVRLALLEADVNFQVVKEFTQAVKEQCLGQEIQHSLTGGQQVIKIVHDELVTLLGGQQQELEFSGNPAVIMLVGLQGAGKTTTAAKLALHLRRNKRTPLLVPADVSRPAAIEQLQTLAKQLDIPAFASGTQDSPLTIAEAALHKARELGCDTLILDTAGRLHIDEPLMEELVALKATCSPCEILFVADAMTGQDAVTVAQSFTERLNLSGIILTKMDGDARGGAALSIKSVTGTPIKFVGMGEGTADLEVFHPDRIASRILGMGDILTLIEKASDTVSEEEAEALGKKFQRAEFNFEDFRTQMRRMKKLGSLEGLLKLVPGMKGLSDKLGDMDVPDKELGRVEAMINSMTQQERQNPGLLNKSRRTRIARGSGMELADVNKLVKNFEGMKKMMKKMMRGGGMPQMPQIPGMGMPGTTGAAGAALPGMDGADMGAMQGPSKSFFTKAKKVRRKKNKARKGKKKK